MKITRDVYLGGTNPLPGCALGKDSNFMDSGDVVFPLCVYFLTLLFFCASKIQQDVKMRLPSECLLFLDITILLFDCHPFVKGK